MVDQDEVDAALDGDLLQTVEQAGHAIVVRLFHVRWLEPRERIKHYETDGIAVLSHLTEQVSKAGESYIVEGLGNPESFHSCSHGAGRRMSRGQAKKTFTVADHIRATAGVECRKDAGVLDETPGAYKDIDAVMEAQSDLVRIRHTLKALICVKG